MVEVIRDSGKSSLLGLFMDRPPAGMIYRHGTQIGRDAESGWYPAGRWHLRPSDCIARDFSSSDLFRIYLHDRTRLGIVQNWAERAERITGGTVTIIEVATESERRAATAGF